HFGRELQRIRLRLGLSEDKRAKFVACEGTRAIENRAIKIALERQAVDFDRVCDFLVTVGVFVPIEAELFSRRAPRSVSPAVRQQHAADIEENRSDHYQR